MHDNLGWKNQTKQLDIFCRVTGFTSDFLSFIVVELWSPSGVVVVYNVSLNPGQGQGDQI